MIPTNILNIFTKQVPSFLIIVTGFIAAIIFVRLSKKGWSELSKIIINRITKILIASIIPMLTKIYLFILATLSFLSKLIIKFNIYISQKDFLILSLPAIFSLGILILLSVVILFIESERFVSLSKEIENFEDWRKIAIKIFDNIPFILAIILAYSAILLAIFPTDITLINTISIIIQIYIFIIALDIGFFVLAKSVVID